MKNQDKFNEDWKICKGIANKFLLIQYRNKYFKKRIFKADILLFIEFILITTLSYILIYSSIAWHLKLIILIPWSIYSALTIDNVIHYINHWNLFKKNWINYISRLIGIFSFNFILEQKYHHFEHHKYNNTLQDPLTTLFDEQKHQTFYEFVLKDIHYYFLDCLPLVKLPKYLIKLKKQNKSNFREIICTRWFCIVWFCILLLIDYKNTLFYYLPFIVLLPPVITFTMSLTDHVPGNPNHVFRQATYYQPKSKYESILSFLNHHSAATHLTHHLFPQVHWIFLQRLQFRILNIYEKHCAPKSIILNSFLIGNPFRLIKILKELDRLRATKN